MPIKTSTKDSEMTMRVSGRFDFGLHREFRDNVENIPPEIKGVSIDLSATEYIDSSALGMLLMLRDKLGGNTSAVKLVRAHPEVQKILEIANFGKLFEIGR